jgi:signal transduction histidine kinase
MRPANLHRATWIAVLIAALLVLLAGLQYRWLGELSEFEQRRMQANLRSATERFSRDFDREIDHVYYDFHIRRGRDVHEEIAEDYEEWASSFPFPDLIDTAYWVSRTHEDGLLLQQIHLPEIRFEDAEWPPQLEPLRNEISKKLEDYGKHRERSRLTFEDPLRSDIPALVVFQYDRRTPSWAIVVLRRDVLIEQFLPARVGEYFGGTDDLAYNIWIVDRSDGDRIVYSSNPSSPPDLSDPDIERGVFSFDYADDEQEGDHAERHWSVVVKHQAGSLEAAVNSLRRRNLAVSFGIVLLVGASVLLLIVATRRAQALAEQQMEFVAGVSHELRTPLAGISSLSQNLADGVVQEMGQAEEYGKVIHRESRRLGHMVERVLQFSAVRSGIHRYEKRPLALQDVIHGAMETLGPDARQRYEITVEIEEALPLVEGDERALSSLIQNLLSNAMKFSDDGGTIRLVARQIGCSHGEGREPGAAGATDEGASGGELQVSIEDQGKGIPSSELPHIFKPFFRGRAARRDQVEGSGLGLGLAMEVAQAHGGTVTVTSTEGSGTTFTLHLPLEHRPASHPPADRPSESEAPPAGGEAGDGSGA